MIKNVYSQTQPVYMPEIRQALTRFHSLKRVMPLVSTGAPTHVCGKAHRVGYTSVVEGKQALYRLTLSNAGRKGATLPGFFLLVNGVFVAYGSSNPLMRQHQG